MKIRPLNRSITLVCVLFITALSLILSAASYQIYTTMMFDRYQKQMKSVLDYVESRIDKDDMAVCARTYEESERYQEFQSFFDDLIDYYEDVHYLYILQVVEAGEPMRVREICAANSTWEKENEPDMLYYLGDGGDDWLAPDVADRFFEIQMGDEDVYLINPTTWGTDYTLARPLISSGGDHYANLCVDIDINELNATIYRNIHVNIAVIILSGLVFTVLLILWIRVNVTRPLKALEESVTDFAGKSAGKRNPDELVYRTPEIRTKNEVKALSDAVAKLSADMRDYVKGMVTAEKNVEAAQKIAELKQSISALLDNMPAMSFSKDAETGTYLACNQAFAEYAHKKTPEGVVGLTDAQIFDRATAEHFVEDDRMALSMDEPYIFFEDVPDAAGNQRQFQTTKLKFIDSTGRLCLLGMCADVTDMVRIQRENATTKEAYEKARSVGVMYTHMAQTLARDYTDIFYVNLDTEAFIEYHTDDKRGALIEVRRGPRFFESCKTEVERYVYPDDRDAFVEAMERETLLDVLNRNETFIMTYRVMIDNQTKYVRMKISRMENDEDCIIIGITNVDVETREAMAKNEALAEALAAAKEASKAKSLFLSNMSHEIRTPMNAIIGLDALALRDETLSGQTRDYLRKIEGSARHLLQLINDILDMSRIESGRLVLRKEKFSVSAMLEQINTMVMAQCDDKGLSYTCRILNKADDAYIGDDMKLKEVLINILSNAIKFTDAPGSVTLTLERTATFEDQSVLRFCVKDTGIGMDKEFIPKIFESFSQEDGGRKNKYGSAGLGMAITKRIVEMMNGSIHVESEKGVGTEFTVTVTLKNCAAGEDDREHSIDPRSMYVLVVDDDEIAVEHARIALDEAGIRADVCTGGAEALRMMEVRHTKRNAYNLVLLDWKMPGMDGLETCEKIRTRYGNETAVVMLTEYNWDDIREKALGVGVDGFLNKPLFVSNVMEEFQRIARRNHLDVFKEIKRAELAGRRVLLAEDMEINAEIMMDILSMEKIQADHAQNGRIAVEMFANSPAGTYAAILMDVRMPEMDGLEATAAIRALDRPDAGKIPIIALTANAFDEDVQRSLQSGMNAHLSKPVEPERLCQTLGELIYEAENPR